MRVRHNDQWVAFNDELQCTATRVVYDFPSRTGTLTMTPGACCSMTGCIALFKRIDQKCGASTLSPAMNLTLWRTVGADADD